jgi:hypothetical protein
VHRLSLSSRGRPLQRTAVRDQEDTVRDSLGDIAKIFDAPGPWQPDKTARGEAISKLVVDEHRFALATEDDPLRVARAVTRVYEERDVGRLPRDEANRDIRQLRDAYRRHVGDEIQDRLLRISELEYELEYLIAKLRLHFVSWREIGELLGISPQLAHYRYRHVTRESRTNASREQT